MKYTIIPSLCTLFVLSACSVQVAPKAEATVQWQNLSITNPFCIPEAKELVALEEAGVANLTPQSVEESQKLNRYIRLSERMFFDTDCVKSSSRVRSGNVQDIKGAGSFFKGLAAENSKDSPVSKDDVVAFRLYTNVASYRSKEGANQFFGTPKWNEFLERRRRAASFGS
jgi:hypothetical protein